MLASMLLLSSSLVVNSGDSLSTVLDVEDPKANELATDKHGQGCCCTGCKDPIHK